LGLRREVAKAIGSSVPVLHSPAYEDETDSEFRKVGN